MTHADPDGPYLWWPDSNISYKINSNGCADIGNFESLVSAVNAGFQTWQNSTDISITFSYDDFTAASYGVDGENVISWDIHATWSSAAITLIKFNTTTCEISEVDIFFNEAIDWGLGQDHDVQSTVTHEVGHLLGIAHAEPFTPEYSVYEIDDYALWPTMLRAGYWSDELQGVCFNYLGSPNFEVRSLAPDDIAAAEYLYGDSLRVPEVFPSVADAMGFGQSDQIVYLKSGTDTISNSTSFPCDLVIESGATFSVGNGVTLTIADGKGITVKGDLNLNSNSVLTTNGSYWDGIDIESSGDLFLRSGATIEKAIVGVYSNSSSLYGPTCSHVTIQDCRDWGLVVSNVPMYYFRNVLFDNNGTGSNGAICVTGGSANPIIQYCTMDESPYGLYISSYSEASMEHSDITNGCTNHRVMMQSGSDLDISYGYNNIRDNSGTYYAIYTSGNNVNALGNYFNSSPVASQIFSNPAKITNWDNTITSPYTAGAPAKITSSSEDLLAQACNLERTGNIANAISFYEQVLSSDNQSEKRSAIKGIIRLRVEQKQSLDGIRTIIRDELITAKGWYKESLDYLLCDILLREGKELEAIATFLDKAELYVGSPMQVEMLARVATIYGDCLNDPDSAKKYADMAAKINPGQMILMAAYKATGIYYNASAYENTLQNTPKPAEPEPETITENTVSVFPNPANPVSIISYSITEPSHVQLSVYSISGQKVTTLVDTYREAGLHTATFDGSDLASGLYFYRFESNSFAGTGKLMLLK